MTDNLIPARGVIYNPARAGQLRDFSGLRFDKITPTDIDGLIEYQNRAYVLMEFKYGEAQMPYGQRLAFERLRCDLGKVKPTLAIIAQHEQEPGTPIDCAHAIAREVWNGSIPLPHACGYTVQKVISGFFKWLDKGV